MASKNRLSKSMTLDQFDKGYWYVNEIKAFAKEIGIDHSSKLRKDELEKLIKSFVQTGHIKNSLRKNIIKTGRKDLDIGLTTSLPIIHYTSNKQTKNFIKSEAFKRSPGLKVKSGVWYRLNRWRDGQITNRQKITYGNLVDQFIKLNRENHFEPIPVGRYINFLAGYLANEKNATRQQAINEWKKLKGLDIAKDYESWKQFRKMKS
jgi:hypothetical protein